jgi:predicted P-loop ATPase
LQSQTGNRRFWPLACGKIDIKALRRDRLQLLGEAAHYESEGESLVLDEALWPDARDEQEKRRVKHPWEDILANIPEVRDNCDFHQPAKKKNALIRYTREENGVTFEEVAGVDLLTHVLHIPEGQQRRDHSMQLATVMKLLGWERKKEVMTFRNDHYVLVRGYRRRTEKVFLA